MIVIVAIGTMAHAALDAAASLQSDGISCAVINARFVKPLDRERIVALARRCGALVTVEEHSAMGGFGSAVLEALAEAGVPLPTRCLAVPDRLVEHGDPGEILASLGLDADGIERAVRELLGAARDRSTGAEPAPR